jgi:hypothetical protein
MAGTAISNSSIVQMMVRDGASYYFYFPTTHLVYTARLFHPNPIWALALLIASDFLLIEN